MTLKIAPQTAGFQRTVAVLALLGSMLSLTFGTTFAKQLFLAVGVPGTAFLRVAFATAILLAFNRPWRQRLDRRRAMILIAYGATVGTMNLLFYSAIHTLPFGIAVAIEFIGPLAVALASSRRAIDVLWVILAALGLALLLPFGHSAPLDPTGVGFAFAAAFCWGIYVIIGRHAGNVNGGQAVSVGMVVATLVVAPFGTVQSMPAFQDMRLLALAVGMGLFSSALPYSLEIVSLRHLPRHAFGTLLSLEPAVAALMAWALMDEHLTFMQWMAIVSIIAASIGATLTLARAKPASDLEIAP